MSSALVATFLLGMTTGGSAYGSEKVKAKPLSRERVVRSIEKIEIKPTINGNWRGPAILSKERMKEIVEKYGIKTIINLAKDSMHYQKGDECGGYKDARRYCEPKWAAELGVDYLEGFMSDKRPALSSWRRIKEAMRASDAYIHCTWGADRTGAVIARYTLETEVNTDKRELYNVALRNGFKPKSHPGYGRHPDPNRKLREWMLSGNLDKEFRPPKAIMSFKIKLEDQ